MTTTITPSTAYTTCAICKNPLSVSSAITFFPIECVGQKIHRFHRECMPQVTVQYPRASCCDKKVTVITGLPIASIPQKADEARRALLQHQRTLSQHQLIIAAGKGSVSQVQQLLGAGTFPDDVLGMAFVQAAAKGYLDIVQLFDIHSISQKYRDSAFEQAVARQYHDIVRFLIGANAISPKTRFWAVPNAAKNRDLETVELLLASGPISENAREAALLNATEARDFETVKLLLARGPISKNNVRGRSVQIAAKNGSFETVALLLANGPIDIVDRGLAVMQAAGRGDLPILKRLLDSGFVSEGYLLAARGDAASKNFQPIVDLLQSFITKQP